VGKVGGRTAHKIQLHETNGGIREQESLTHRMEGNPWFKGEKTEPGRRVGGKRHAKLCHGRGKKKTKR